MARWVWREMGPWKRQPLTIPPDSVRAWVTLAAWEFWIGALVCVALVLGIALILTAPSGIVTVFDFTNCYAPGAVQPCERVAYRTGQMSAVLNLWCAVLLIAVGAWLLWDLWSAAAPAPITDDFLKLLDDSFARDWRRPRTWPWARIAWAYAFTLMGATAALCIGLLVTRAMSSSSRAQTPTPRVETSQRFRAI